MTRLQAAEHIIALVASYEKTNGSMVSERRTAAAMAIGALLNERVYSPYGELFNKGYLRSDE